MNTEIQKINELMNEKNLNVPALAKKIGLTKQAVYDFMSEKTELKLKNLKKIAAVFNVPVSYFFGESEINGQLVQNGHINMNGTNNGQIQISEARHEIEKLSIENESLKSIMQSIRKQIN